MARNLSVIALFLIGSSLQTDVHAGQAKEETMTPAFPWNVGTHRWPRRKLGHAFCSAELPGDCRYDGTTGEFYKCVGTRCDAGHNNWGGFS